ncbi:MAG: TIGR03619 family F420-dependent LLM class oxidoreductase [Myxococcota bacterium]
MRFSFSESMCDPKQLPILAVAAEEAGYSSFTVPDSIGYPEFSDTKYPFSADGGREFLKGRPFIDPFILIGALAAVTNRIHFLTFVVKLAVRQPVLVAKQAMSLAVLSDNRFRFGVGLSPWPEDFSATGVGWGGRGKRMDEMIEILRGLETGEFFEFYGKHFDLASIQLCPAPTERIPILVGGHSEAALKRAARTGSGWIHAGGDESELIRTIDRLGALREEFGMADQPFEIHAVSRDAYTPDGCRRLEAMGVTDVVVGVRNAYEPDTMTIDQKLEALKRFGENVIGAL